MQVSACAALFCLVILVAGPHRGRSSAENLTTHAGAALQPTCTGADCNLVAGQADQQQQTAPGLSDDCTDKADNITLSPTCQQPARDSGRPLGDEPLGQPAEAQPATAEPAALEPGGGAELVAVATAAAGQAPAEEQPPPEQLIPPTPEQPAPATEMSPPHEPEEALPEVELRNFALIKDGAKVVQANKEAKKLNALLDGDSDTYVKNDCKADKWFIIELSQVAKINRIELAQYELYSSRVKSFEVRGRQSHPRMDGVELSKGLNSSQWRLLGGLTAENKKGSQLFTLEHPMWVRYLLLQVLSHYGSEAVCAINGFAAYGKSAAEEFEDHLAAEETLQHLQTTLEPSLPPAPEPAAPAPAPVTAMPAGAAAISVGPAAGEGTEARQGGITDAPDQAATSQQPAAVGSGTPAGSESGAQPPSEAAVVEVAAPQDSQPDCVKPYSASRSGEQGGAAGAIQQEQAEQPPSQQQPQQPQHLGAAAAAPEGPAAAAAAAAGEEQQPVSASSAVAAGPGVGNTETVASGAVAVEGGANALQESGAPPPADAMVPHPVAAAAATTDAAQKDGEGARVVPAQPGAGSDNKMAAAGSEQDGSQGVAGVQQGTPAGQQPAAGGLTPPSQLQPAQPAAAAPADGGDDLASVLSWAPKAKASTSVYDILLQEIKNTKVQQKLASKTIADLQRNLTVQHAEQASEVASLAAQLAKVHQEASQLEEALRSKVDAQVDARLQQLSQAVVALQLASEASTRRELAMMCLLSILVAALVLGRPGGGLGQALVRWLLTVLLLAGLGMVWLPLLLQVKDDARLGAAALPKALQRWFKSR